MSSFKLNLPTDIPWERICVTEDMMDKVVCDKRLPAKWQSSMAVYKYKPEEEYQLYPKYNITYLKVTASITGYQPLDQEIQGEIDWDGVDVSTIPGLTDLLNSYNPCHGAILQVVVGPHGRNPKLPLDQYPFIMDFEPKKRELYELASDTNEKSSRSIQSLNVSKSAGTTQSLEVLDVDMGGGGFGAQASYAGTGGGFTYSAPNGQWGSKNLNSEQSMTTRSSDVGQEKRESSSHTTQISQMYHLLDSYHVGTNRAVFFIQPRPHTLEEPSGFVRGPRPVDGIQEFFLVVAQPKDQDDFCVSLRLDTSHITTTPIMDYDRTSETTDLASATARVATKHDIPAENIVGARACFGGCWDVHYQCYRTESTDSVTYNAPAGYKIDSFNDLINEHTHGSTSVVITPNRAALNINVSANGHICYEGSEVCVNCPDTIQEWAGSARRQVQVNLISNEPIKQIGEEEVLLITTRGLCCCASDKLVIPNHEFVVGVKPIPKELSVLDHLKASTNHLLSAATATRGASKTDDHECEECASKNKHYALAAAKTDNRYLIRLANELSNHIKTETIKSLNDPNVKLQRFHETDYFAKQLEYTLVQTKRGRELLNQKAIKSVPDSAVKKLEKYYGKPASDITRSDLLKLRATELAKVTGSNESDIQKMKLSSMGVKFNSKTSRTSPKAD